MSADLEGLSSKPALVFCYRHYCLGLSGDWVKIAPSSTHGLVVFSVLSWIAFRRGWISPYEAPFGIKR